jgi:Lrp/AsnC family leucine-responsive transcriptional regulator
MDAIDIAILRRLMERARTTWAELGSLLGLSAPAAADRVRKLEEAGVIRGYAAIVDPDAAGCGLGAFVSVTLERADDRAAFLDLVRAQPEVLECHHIAGAEDYVLKIRCADTRELERLISDGLKSVPSVRTRTGVILSTVKEAHALPVRVSER